MHLLVAGKSAYSLRSGDTTVPITLAGHTAQFTRPLLSWARARGMRVSYAYPLRPAGCLMTDPYDELPEGVLEVPFTDVEAAKAPLHIGYLSLEASLRRAVEENGALDWVFVPYAFPLAPLLVSLREKYGFKLALFLRGGDGYQWLDPDWEGAVRAYGGAEQARQACALYRESLEAADFVGAASQWLGSVVEKFGGRWDAVVESPAAMGPAHAPGGDGLPWDKGAFLADPGVVPRHGRPDTARAWLLSAGRIHPDKNLDLAADLFAQAALDGWQLVLAGTGAEEHGTGGGTLTRLVEDGRACVIEAPPRVIHALFRVSDAYLQTSLPSDTFVDARPSSVTSAAFHGKPVVVPLAEAGGVAESLSPENLRAYGFDARNLRPADPADRAELVRRGAAAVGGLADAGKRERAGAANARHAAGSSVDAVFDRVWARLGES
ncbi:glycosyltransferase [Streptomyces sp. ODS28]|uniref:glycosyltransferase n=1 Tax=Streptomyces sp. ODS28 TaxID=3136688 RepID=UPI0031F0F257